MPSSHHRQDKTVLSCFVGCVNRIGDKSRLFSVVLNILETEQFCPVLSVVWTRLQTSLSCKLETGWRQYATLSTLHFETGQNSFEIFYRQQSWLIANILFTPPTRTRQNKTRQDNSVLSCPCRWCKLCFTVQTSTKAFSGVHRLRPDRALCSLWLGPAKLMPKYFHSFC